MRFPMFPALFVPTSIDVFSSPVILRQNTSFVRPHE
jgi:hypothetical protein